MPLNNISPTTSSADAEDTWSSQLAEVGPRLIERVDLDTYGSASSVLPGVRAIGQSAKMAERILTDSGISAPALSGNEKPEARQEASIICRDNLRLTASQHAKPRALITSEQAEALKIGPDYQGNGRPHKAITFRDGLQALIHLDGRRPFVVRLAGPPCLWSANTKGETKCLALSDEKWLVTISKSGVFEEFEIGKPIGRAERLPVLQGTAQNVGIAPHNGCMVVGVKTRAGAYKLAFRSAEDLASPWRYAATGPRSFDNIEFRADGRYAIIDNRDWVDVVQRSVHQDAFSGANYGLKFIGNTGLVAGATKKERCDEARVWDTATNLSFRIEAPRSADAHAPVEVAVSPDGAYVAVTRLYGALDAAYVHKSEDLSKAPVRINITPKTDRSEYGYHCKFSPKSNFMMVTKEFSPSPRIGGAPYPWLVFSTKLLFDPECGPKKEFKLIKPHESRIFLDGAFSPDETFFTLYTGTSLHTPAMRLELDSTAAVMGKDWLSGAKVSSAVNNSNGSDGWMPTRIYPLTFDGRWLEVGGPDWNSAVRVRVAVTSFDDKIA